MERGEWLAPKAAPGRDQGNFPLMDAGRYCRAPFTKVNTDQQPRVKVSTFHEKIKSRWGKVMAVAHMLMLSSPGWY